MQARKSDSDQTTRNLPSTPCRAAISKRSWSGDGSESAYQRVRSAQFQAVTVAEPLRLQGWQLVDEMNRALDGEEWSGYVSPLHKVTLENIEFDGGPNNTFDPENDYQEAYMKIWSGS